MHNGSQQCYPCLETTAWDENSGMTKREYFAITLLNGMLPMSPISGVEISLSKNAVVLADALLAELDKDNGNG